ncbi:MAG: DJ-1/PfpI family protein [Acetobacteraceae bacterium]
MTKIIAILATHGVEEVELLKPWKKLKKAGFETVLVALEKGRIQSMRGDRTELVAAGARWKDEALVEDRNMISSRNPDDLDIFCEALLGQYERATPKAQPRRKALRAAPAKVKRGAEAEEAKARSPARARKRKPAARPATVRQGA